MPDHARAFASLDSAIADAASAAELSSLALGLASRMATVAVKVAAPEGDGLLTVAEACNIALVRPRLLYSWSRGKSWAIRPPGTGVLRVKEAGFRKWLEKKRAPKPRSVSASTRKTPERS
jgi:hypothetical protein